MDLQKIKDVNVCLISLTRPIFFMFLIYLAYLLIGSFCFVTFEAFEDIRTRNQSAQEIVMARNIATTLMHAGFSKEEINLAFEHEREVRKGTAKPKNIPLTQLYGEKIFFAFILITTIGYGNVAPSTQHGRLICIAYTLFGMPIHVIMMRLLSYEIRSVLRKFLLFAQTFFHSYRIVLFIFGSCFLILLLAVFILVPAYVFVQSDGWDYRLGVYFSFVSLTTIGLGDYVAGVSGEHLQDPLYSLFVVGMLIWLVFGLAFVYMAVNTLSYLLGIVLLDLVDSKCRRRTTAKRRLKPLLDIIKDLNWNLVKLTPKNFKHAAYIEEFKEQLVENPQDVTYEQLLEVFRIMSKLKEDTYDDLSELVSAGIPPTPIIESVRDNLPEFLSQETTTVTFRGDKKAEDGTDPASETDQEDELMPRFQFGSAIDLGDIMDRDAGEDEDAEEDKERHSASEEEQEEEVNLVSIEKDSTLSQKEERNKKQ